MSARPRSTPAEAANPLRTALTSETTSLDEELVKASALCNSGRAQVMSMFSEARLGKAVHA